MPGRWQERLQNYKKSVEILNETIQCIGQNGLNKIYTMALVQAFEICFELAWKTMKDYLEFNGIKTDTPRDTIKTAFSTNLIKDGQGWIEMMEARNKTSHTYRETFANQLADDILQTYSRLIENFETTMDSKING